MGARCIIPSGQSARSIKSVGGTGDEVDAGVLVANDFDDVVVERVLHSSRHIEAARHVVASEEIQASVVARGPELTGKFPAMIGHEEVRADVELRLLPGQPQIAHVACVLDDQGPASRGLIDISIGSGVAPVRSQPRRALANRLELDTL